LRRWVSEQFGNSIGVPLDDEGHEVIDVHAERLSAGDSGNLGWRRPQLKVLRPVVRSDAVDVVYVLP
jgi:hypothetical protein